MCSLQGNNIEEYYLNTTYGYAHRRGLQKRSGVKGSKEVSTQEELHSQICPTYLLT
jgi:hypothetical protein